jgi:hypothetical protein
MRDSDRGMGLAEAKNGMGGEGRGLELSPYYQRCSKGHGDLWFDSQFFPICPLCEVIGRGWGKAERR